jgi:hypothetical protein
MPAVSAAAEGKIVFACLYQGEIEHSVSIVAISSKTDELQAVMGVLLGKLTVKSVGCSSNNFAETIWLESLCTVVNGKLHLSNNN